MGTALGDVGTAVGGKDGRGDGVGPIDGDMAAPYPDGCEHCGGCNGAHCEYAALLHTAPGLQQTEPALHLLPQSDRHPVPALKY